MAATQIQPLPPNPYSAVINLEQRQNAYSCCLDRTTSAAQIILARVLGYLIIEAPIQEGQAYLLVKQNKGSTPAPSENPSRPSLTEEASWFRCPVDESLTDHRTAKQLYLARDRFHCLGCGKMEFAYYRTLTPAEQAQVHDFVNTNASHIFPPPTNQDLDADRDLKTQYSAIVEAIVHNFSGISVLDKLDGSSIHRLSNILTLGLKAHKLFDDLQLWFEAVPLSASPTGCRPLLT
ncbi:hypothetical protein M413DRAFT_23432 [Hebeloma cylindrosporum]|uniref:Uncharacterized protein n=1 Tax=Hebeloma cylindrosporum TaxID=76867 RepID=A0A0C2YBI6_HEBCY|nr:hypothetical protein M413DRAFT_23432 [Hebeloma cylindrosporum h7]